MHNKIDHINKPTSESDRIQFLDALRGFALFGILMANLYSYVGYNTLSPNEIISLAFADKAVLFFIDLFIEGKFYTIFSMLFGLGCALQLARFKHGYTAFRSYWLRRMFVLLLIGLTHMLFVWNGDILTLYSILGIVLILCVRASTKSLLIVTIVMLVFPVPIHILVMYTQDASFWSLLRDVSTDWRAQLGFADLSLLEMRTSSNSFEVMMINILSAVNRPMSYLITGRYFQVFGMFLMGVLIGRLYISTIRNNAPIAKKVWLIPGLIGLAAHFVYAWIKGVIGSPYSLDTLGLVQALVYHLFVPFLAIGIAGLFYSLYQSKKLMKVMGWLATTGRMALSNYILQNIIAILLFFGYGFALMREVPFSIIPFIAIVIFLSQNWLSRIWLSKYSQGPFELAWKKLAYKH